ncbi:hypothetical protein SNEBB_004547, partial [Seison nebaliae]
NDVQYVIQRTETGSNFNTLNQEIVEWRNKVLNIQDIVGSVLINFRAVIERAEIPDPPELELPEHPDLAVPLLDQAEPPPLPRHWSQIDPIRAILYGMVIRIFFAVVSIYGRSFSLTSQSEFTSNKKAWIILLSSESINVTFNCDSLARSVRNSFPHHLRTSVRVHRRVKNIEKFCKNTYLEELNSNGELLESINGLFT